LNKNLDLTQDKEKPTVKETSAISIDKIVPDIEHVSNDMAEQQSSSAGGQDKKEKTGDKPTGLTGTQTSLTGASNESESSSKKKIRPSFKKLLAKYEKQGATQKKKKQMGRSGKAKDEKTYSKSCEQLDPRSSQGNCAAMSYLGSVVPWFWPYPSCYTPLDYSRMYIQSFYSQYPSMYPSCVSQRPISNNLVEKDPNCSKEGEKNVKEDSKYLKPRWCPSGLSHTRKRRLQHLRKQESMEQQVEVGPTQLVIMKKV
jgi:hypothetical protein